MIDWARYARYLDSEKWKLRKRAPVMERAEGICEIDNCSRAAFAVHHLTYDRLYDEELTDLIALCIQCHKTLTEAEGECEIGCIGDAVSTALGDPCFCLVCENARKETWLKRRLRKQFVRQLNRDLQERLVMRYGGDLRPGTRYAGIGRRNDLPSSMICRMSGYPAPRIGCRCDTCRWVRALETDFARNEREGEDDDR